MNKLTEQQITEIETSYIEGNPIITDFEYDQLNLPKEKNSIKSMRSIFDIEELKDFLHKNFQYDEYLIEPKIDGMTLLLFYKNGNLVSCQTKGNKNAQQRDIFNTIKNIDNIPLKIEFLSDLVIRGELTIEKNFFLENLKHEFSSVRSCVCGSVYSKDNKLVITRNIKFIAFYFENNIFKYHSENKNYFEKYFCIVPTIKYNLDFTIIIKEIEQSYPFYCDGIVFKINSLVDVRDEKIDKI